MVYSLGNRQFPIDSTEQNPKRDQVYRITNYLKAEEQKSKEVTLFPVQ